jgi:predicted nuclease with TOPRIM domain
MEKKKTVLVSKSKYNKLQDELEELEAEFALLEMLFFKLSDEYSQVIDKKAQAKKRHPSTSKKPVAKKAVKKV